MTLDEKIASSLADIRELESQAVDIKVRMSVLENAKNTDRDKNAAIIDEINGYKRCPTSLRAELPQSS